MKKNGIAGLLIAAIIVALFPFSLSATTGPEPPSQFLIVPIAEISEEAEVYSEFFLEAISIELKSAGIPVISPDATEVGAINAGITDAEILALGKDVGADFVLICLFGSTQRKMRLKFSCYDIETGTIVAEVTERIPLDLGLDQTIAESMATILQSAQDRIVYSDSESDGPDPNANNGDSADDESDAVVLETSSQQDKDTASQQESPESDGDPSPDSAVSSASENGSTIALGDASTISSGTNTVPSDEIQSSRGNRISFSIGYSPFLPVGRSAEYFESAIMPAITTGINLFIAATKIRTGIYSAFCWFTAEGTQISSNNMLIPAGLHVDVTGGGSESIAFLLRLSGGPAFFGVNADEAGYRFKILPYALGTVGISAAFGKTYGMSIELSFSAFFEPDYPIMGYMPGVRLYLSN